jgi:hypothetical protein
MIPNPPDHHRITVPKCHSRESGNPRLLEPLKEAAEVRGDAKRTTLLPDSVSCTTQRLGWPRMLWPAMVRKEVRNLRRERLG